MYKAWAARMEKGLPDSRNAAVNLAKPRRRSVRAHPCHSTASCVSHSLVCLWSTGWLSLVVKEVTA